MPPAATRAMSASRAAVVVAAAAQEPVQEAHLVDQPLQRRARRRATRRQLAELAGQRVHPGVELERLALDDDAADLLRPLGVTPRRRARST